MKVSHSKLVSNHRIYVCLVSLRSLNKSVPNSPDPGLCYKFSLENHKGFFFRWTRVWENKFARNELVMAHTKLGKSARKSTQQMLKSVSSVSLNEAQGHTDHTIQLSGVCCHTKFSRNPGLFMPSNKVFFLPHRPLLHEIFTPLNTDQERYKWICRPSD